MSEDSRDQQPPPPPEAPQRSTEPPPQLAPSAGHGVDVMVKKAAVDDLFRARLLAERGEVATELGIELSPSEKAMLTSVTADQLESMISITTVPPAEADLLANNDGAKMVARLELEKQRQMHELELQPLTGIRPDLPFPYEGSQWLRVILLLLLTAGVAAAIYWLVT